MRVLKDQSPCHGKVVEVVYVAVGVYDEFWPTRTESLGTPRREHHALGPELQGGSQGTSDPNSKRASEPASCWPSAVLSSCKRKETQL